MIPVVFGGCRGWLSLPMPGLPLRDGIVVFSAYGVEELSTRYSLARLAERLAAIGHPVLRFDLPGSGDSLGDWADVGQLRSWLAAGKEAVGSLKNWGGVASVSFIGLRLGGMIATLVAQELKDAGSPVRSLALLGPVVQGRQYIREMRTLSDSPQAITVAGFSLSEETGQAISQVDLGNFLQAPTTRIFLGVPGVSKAIGKLQAQWSMDADVVQVPYADMVQHIGNSVMTRTPVDMFDQLVAWFAADKAFGEEGHHCAKSVFLSCSCGTTDAVLSAAGYVEEAHFISSEVNLVGVWCRPQVTQVSAPVVVFCSPGRNPHMGMARGWVTLARRLAHAGISSLRFDLAGVGDSPPLHAPPTEILYNKVGFAQLRAVIDHVDTLTHGQSPICVAGICSGGYLAFHEAVADARVAGLVLVNVQCFVWQEGTSLREATAYIGHSTITYRKKLLEFETWKRLARGRINVAYLTRSMILRAKRGSHGLVQHLYHHLLRPLYKMSGRHANQGGAAQAEICRGFATMAQRGTKVVVVYGEEEAGRDEFARYFGSNGRRFTRLPNSSLLHLADFDHNVTLPRAIDQLFDVLRNVTHSLARSLSRH